jgi:lysophospholipase L1-like esterase
MEPRLFTHCLEVRKTPDGLLPLRFTDAQLAVYGRKPDWGVRSLCPAGIRIDTMTDAAGLELEYKFLGRSRDYHYTDVCVDGLLAGCHGSQTPVTGFRFRQELPPSGGKPRRVTVHLPYTSHVVISRFELSGHSVAEPAPAEKKRLLLLGDSITQGMDAKHPSCIYATLLSRFLGMDSLNQGVGGYGFNPESLDPGLPFTPDLIIVAYGSNDWFHNDSLEDIRTSCDEYMRKVISIFPDRPIAAITPIWRLDINEKRPAGTFMEMVAAIESVNARLKGVKTIRGLELLPHLTDMMGDRRVHPSDEGFLHMALNLARALKNLGMAG